MEAASRKCGAEAWVLRYVKWRFGLARGNANMEEGAARLDSAMG